MEEHGYTVMRVLGQGSGCSSRVYEVKDSTGQLRVVKQLPWVVDADKETALREVKLLSSLRHPCIVPYLESFLVRSTPSLPAEDILCLVMSRCDRDLRQEALRIRLEWELQGEPYPGHGPAGRAHFEEDMILWWLSQLVWGLQHLHSRKFLHRDLKPQNVLLTQGGKRAMLADFGVAGQVEHTEDLKRSIVGTPSFMSPEMLEGRPYGLKTDQWALGCVLYEMMALEPPFAGRCESYAAVVSAVLHAPPIEAPSGYSADLSAALESLLARKPHNRPSNRALLQGRLLRQPFHAFLQSLDSSAVGLSGVKSWAKKSEKAAAAADAKKSGSSQHAVGLARRAVPVLRNLHAPIASIGASEVQTANASPAYTDRGSEVVGISGSSSEVGSPEGRSSSHTKSQAMSSAASALFNSSLGTSLKTAGLPVHLEDGNSQRSPSHSLQPSPPRRAMSADSGGSYAPDFESDSESSPVHAHDAAEDFDFFAYDADDLVSNVSGNANSKSEGGGDSQGFATTSEWRQLLAEAESLLLPMPEVGALEEFHEEARKLQATLATSLGGEANVERALIFLHDRRPLGDTMEADELLLQVELLDLLGDEGIQTLPLLERLQQIQEELSRFEESTLSG